MRLYNYLTETKGKYYNFNDDQEKLDKITNNGMLKDK